MQDFSGVLWGLWKKQQLEKRAVSSIITKEGCYLTHLSFTCAPGAAGTIGVYDGESSGDDRKFDIDVLAGDSKSLSILFPLPFNKGLYVAVGGNVNSFTVGFIPRR